MIRRFLLPGIAFLGLLSVLLAPQTGWLARMQVKMTWLNQGEAEIKRLITLPAPVASTPAMEAAWKLNALCTEDEHQGWTRADIEQVLYGGLPQEKQLDAALGKEILHLCAIGEQDDPENAFFPVLRGAVFLAFHKDTAALQAVHLAAGKPYFNSYGRAEIDSVRQQLKSAGFTRQVLAIQEVQSRQRMWPTNMNRLFRGVIAHALWRQGAGDWKGSIELRQDLRRLNTLILQDNMYSLPALPLVALLAPSPPNIILPSNSSKGLPMGGYGGSGNITPNIVSAKYPTVMGPNLPNKQRPACYVAFLRQLGYSREALAFEKSMARNEAKKIELTAHWEQDGVLQEEAYRAIWIVRIGLILLTSVVMTLSCGLLARILLFTQGNEVSKKGRIGGLLVFLILVPLVGSALYGSMDNTVRFWFGGAIHACYAPEDETGQKVWYTDLLGALENWGSNTPTIAIALAPIFVAQFIGGIWALVKRRPLGQGVLGGVWRACVPVAALTLLVWCGGIVWLAQEEVSQLARFSEALQQ